jgi:hypothetical protein
MPYRLVYLGLGLLAVAAVVLGVVLNQEGDPVELPPPLEDVSPAPNDVALRQAIVEVDLEVGYEADIYVDGYLVDRADFTEGTGVYRWQPSPTSTVMTQWTPGDHTVKVEWRRVTGTADVGSFEWTFRIQ